jgi:PilX N-terminal
MTSPRSRERGAVTLTTTLLLVLMVLLCLLYAHRSLLLEQRIAAHQTRAAQALAVAESGVAWALARLNDTTRIHPGDHGRCEPSTAPGAQAFRAWYAPTTASADGLTHGHSRVAQARAACSLGSDGGLACLCAPPGSAPSLPGDAAQAFDVRFSAEPGDPSVLRLTVVGCVHSRQPCSVDVGHAGNPGNNNNNNNAVNTSDATARVTHLVKKLPLLQALPRAALTAGGDVQACGATRLVNTGTATVGLLVHAGGNVLTSSCTDLAAVLTPATLHNTSAADVARATASRDQGLQQASAAPSSWLSTWLVQGAQPWGAGLCLISGTHAAERGQQLVAAHQRLHRPCDHFWVTGDIDVSDASTLGRPASAQQAAQPVLIVASGAVRLRSGAQVHGMVVTGSDALQPTEQGARVQGAFAARGRVVAAQLGEIQHDAATLAALAASGPYVMVPGSWIDE